MSGVFYLIIYWNWYSRWVCPYNAVYMIFRTLFYLHVCTFNNTFTGISSYLGYHYFWIWRLETNTLTHICIHTKTHIHMYCAQTLVINIHLEKRPHKPKTKHVIQPNKSKNKVYIFWHGLYIFSLKVYFFSKNVLLKRRKEW